MNKLDGIMAVRETFDPKKKYHMILARDFFRDNKWGQLGCPFVLEWPRSEEHTSELQSH